MSRQLDEDQIELALDYERQKHEEAKADALKQQELDLIKTLVEAGGFRRHEVMNVLK
jgi:hypothetical protein